MTLGFTQSNRNEYQKTFLGESVPEAKADNLTAIWVNYLDNVGYSTSHDPTGLHSLLQG
jgi:hypothetical protein